MVCKIGIKKIGSSFLIFLPTYRLKELCINTYWLTKLLCYYLLFFLTKKVTKKSRKNECSTVFPGLRTETPMIDSRLFMRIERTKLSLRDIPDNLRRCFFADSGYSNMSFKESEKEALGNLDRSGKAGCCFDFTAL